MPKIVSGEGTGTSVPSRRQRRLLADDIFDKAFSFTRVDEALAAGVYPYFKPIAEQRGGVVTVDGRLMIITGSNDYLGLAQDPRLKEAASAVFDSYGTSCTGSRFLTGTLILHEELERRLADFLGAEAVLTFSTGFLGCQSLLAALTGRQDILYFDRENHASLYDGARLAFGTLRKYRHNDVDDLERLLARDAHKPGGRMIVTDGVFSMSGHMADLPAIVRIARKYGARVVVDDAHATGVLGKGGRGTAEHFGLEDDVDLIVGTFSKAFASVGGFVSGPRAVVNYIKHHARPFIFTAAPTAMQVAVTLKALDIMATEPHHREKLLENAARLRLGMTSLGFDTMGSQTQIVPVVIGSDERTVMFWKALWDAGIFATPALPPGVPASKGLIRTSVNANHTPEQVDRLLEAFATVGKRLGILG
ncbi:MAG: pyridoxal phosphate-dependent aminotransferase family protein [Actinomycetota bacterium]|nr:pyridoxal phosphate-dependent aminotransferase family protein [Actinomycetota bacterium]